MYIIQYSSGKWDSHYVENLFITDNKATAVRYVSKFNRLLKKMKKHYQRYQYANGLDKGFLKDDFRYTKLKSWSVVSEMNYCLFTKIEVR